VRVENWRRGHADLMQMIIDRPEVFGPCMMDFAQFESAEDLQQFLFTSLLLNSARVGLDMETLGLDDELGGRRVS
jgi:hypothetical protein